MKLDRKEILKALETISIAGEGKNMVESGAVANVITFGDEVVVDCCFLTMGCPPECPGPVLHARSVTIHPLNWLELGLDSIGWNVHLL